MASMFKIKKDRVELLKALRDIVHKQREAEDISRREERRLRIFCKEIDKWIDELVDSKKEKLAEGERRHYAEFV